MANIVELSFNSSDTSGEAQTPLDAKEQKALEVRNKISTARMQGLRELKEMKELIDNIVKVANGTALFVSYADFLTKAFAPVMEVTESVLKENRLQGCPQEDFNEAKKQIFRMLFNKYCKEDK